MNCRPAVVCGLAQNDVRASCLGANMTPIPISRDAAWPARPNSWHDSSAERIAKSAAVEESSVARYGASGLSLNRYANRSRSSSGVWTSPTGIGERSSVFRDSMFFTATVLRDVSDCKISI